MALWPCSKRGVSGLWEEPSCPWDFRIVFFIQAIAACPVLILDLNLYSHASWNVAQWSPYLCPTHLSCYFTVLLLHILINPAREMYSLFYKATSPHSFLWCPSPTNSLAIVRWVLWISCGNSGLRVPDHSSVPGACGVIWVVASFQSPHWAADSALAASLSYPASYHHLPSSGLGVI